MRAIVALLVSTGCIAGTTDSSFRPAVIPTLSELPAATSHRDAVLDSANQVAGPEHRKGMTAKERKVETGAATLAAIIGSMFSKTKSVTLGTATRFDETAIAPRTRRAAPPRPSDDDDAVNDVPALETPVVPWIKLR